VATTTVRLTEEEMVIACKRLGLGRPVTLPNLEPQPAADDTGPVVDTEPIPDVVVEAMSTLAAPRALVLVHRQDGSGSIALRVVAVGGDVAVEQIANADGPYSLTVVGLDDVTARMVEFVELVERPVAASRTLELSGRTFLRARQDAAPDPEQARRALRGDGLTPHDAEVLTDALARSQRLVSVAIASTPSRRAAAATNIGWFDAEQAGLWQVDAPRLATSGDFGDDGEARLDRAVVRIGPASKHALVEQIERAIAATA
jgi:hypothetical protein